MPLDTIFFFEPSNTLPTSGPALPPTPAYTGSTGTSKRQIDHCNRWFHPRLGNTRFRLSGKRYDAHKILSTSCICIILRMDQNRWNMIKWTLKWNTGEERRSQHSTTLQDVNLKVKQTGSPSHHVMSHNTLKQLPPRLPRFENNGLIQC